MRQLHRMRLNSAAFYSAALLLLGIGIGSGSTLLFQRWRAKPSRPNPTLRSEPKPRLISELAVASEPQLGLTGHRQFADQPWLWLRAQRWVWP